jgi:hypothetical protein
MSWPSNSAQLSTHGRSHTFGPFDDWHLNNLTGTAFLNNITRKILSFFLNINKIVEIYSPIIKESHISRNTIRQILTFESDMHLLPFLLRRPTLPATGDGSSRIRWLCLSLQDIWPSPWHQFCRSGMATETVKQQFWTFCFIDNLCFQICNRLDFLKLIYVYFL